MNARYKEPLYRFYGDKLALIIASTTKSVQKRRTNRCPCCVSSLCLMQQLTVTGNVKIRIVHQVLQKLSAFFGANTHTHTGIRKQIYTASSKSLDDESETLAQTGRKERGFTLHSTQIGRLRDFDLW